MVDSWAELYVDPKDGILKRTQALCKRSGVVPIRKRGASQWRANRKPLADIKKLGPLDWHVRLRGIWYYLRLTAPPRCTAAEILIALKDSDLNDARDWYVLEKRQLPRKVLLRHGLVNSCDETGRVMNEVKPMIIASDKSWIEGAAVQQLETAARLPGICAAAGLPDLHPGKGIPIGAASQ